MLRIISLRTTSQYHNTKTLSLIFRPISYWGGSSYTLVEVGFIISSPIVWRILHMKFLKAVRLDDSDAHVYAAEGGAAVDGEWMVSGGYAVCDLATGHRTTPCHCGTSFVSVGSHGRCTIAEVCHIEPHEYEGIHKELIRYFIEDLGAPSPKAAREAADDECAYTAELAAGFSNEVWISVNRESAEDGIAERYSVFERLMIGAYKM